MEYRSNLSDKEPFACLPGHGEEIVSFIGGIYLPSLPGSFEARAERAERSAAAFGTAGREAKKASGVLGEALGRAAKVADFFSQWGSFLPDLSAVYSFSRFEGDQVVLESPFGARLKRKRFDEAQIEKALSEYMGGERVKVKIVQNLQKQA